MGNIVLGLRGSELLKQLFEDFRGLIVLWFLAATPEHSQMEMVFLHLRLQRWIWSLTISLRPWSSH